MGHTQAFNTPLEITKVDNEVAITGPDGVAISLTREAAIASAKRLLDAAGVEDDDIYQKPLG
ncbi:hypothetical protein [Phenylobacterium immobile]|uniref:hypothetical protein n=1 Tax=Phenylobacterium immobile TaxID=21 RepID=UPI000AAFD90D|nr:hypothetical protein [Phenylobacterium immobile]